LHVAKAALNVPLIITMMLTKVSVTFNPSHPHDDPGTKTTSQKKKQYTAHTVRRRRTSVARRLRDYVVMSRWLRKGCSREEQGTVTSPTSKGWNGTNVLKLTIAHLPQRSHGRP
jgi:hypothetical protein